MSNELSGKNGLIKGIHDFLQIDQLAKMTDKNMSIIGGRRFEDFLNLDQW